MILNRRTFLDFCGKAFATFAAASNASVMASENLYVNRKLGMAFHPPGGWRILNASQMGDIPAGSLFAIEEGILRQGEIDWLSQPFLTLHSNGRNGDVFAHFYVADMAKAFNELSQLLDFLGDLPAPDPLSDKPIEEEIQLDLNLTETAQDQDLPPPELDDDLKGLAALTGILGALPSEQALTSSSGKAFEVKRSAHEFVKDQNAKSLSTISSSLINGNRIVIVQMQSEGEDLLPSDFEFIEFLDKIRFLSNK